MYYYTVVLLLFRPFPKIKFVNSDISPRQKCTKSARKISSLASTYKSIYGLRYSIVVLIHLISTACITYLLDLLYRFRQAISAYSGGIERAMAFETPRERRSSHQGAQVSGGVGCLLCYPYTKLVLLHKHNSDDQVGGNILPNNTPRTDGNQHRQKKLTTTRICSGPPFQIRAAGARSGTY